jgi:glycosyltransferase involved in cell wall biosynthesis
VADTRVTIAVPTRDRHTLLRRAVQSALGQTFSDIEVIVVDDGSAEPVRLHDVADERVRVVRHPTSRGLCAARNTGLAQAKGSWIVFLDDDDELTPEMVEFSLAVAGRSTLPPPVAAMTGLEFIGPNDSQVQGTELPRTVARGGPLFGNGQLHEPFAATLLAPVEVLRSIGGWDQELRAWMEDDLLIRLSRVCSLEADPRITYRAHNHLGLRLHLDHAAMIAGFERTLAKHPDVFAANRRLYARNLAGVGAVHMRARSWWPALRSYWASWRLDPGRPNAVRQVVAGAIGPYAYNAYRGARRRLVGRRLERSGTADVGSG